jgi:hypothetical protein
MEAGLNKATAGFAREVWRLYFWALANAAAERIFKRSGCRFTARKYDKIVI